MVGAARRASGGEGDARARASLFPIARRAACGVRRLVVIWSGGGTRNKTIWGKGRGTGRFGLVSFSAGGAGCGEVSEVVVVLGSFGLFIARAAAAAGAGPKGISTGARAFSGEGWSDDVCV